MRRAFLSYLARPNGAKNLLGDEVIPDEWIYRLENPQKIEHIACEMHRIFRKQSSDFLKKGK